MIEKIRRLISLVYPCNDGGDLTRKAMEIDVDRHVTNYVGGVCEIHDDGLDYHRHDGDTDDDQGNEIENDRPAMI